MAALEHYDAGARRPSGFIFHVSRCGSTLVTHALSQIAGVAAVCEAQPVSAALQHKAHHLVRQVIAALGDIEGAAQYVVKPQSMDTLELAAIRAAWPDVPWIIVCREPAEVIVSQLKRPGGWLRGKRARNARMSDEHYCAKTIGHFCTAAARSMDDLGRVVDYSEISPAKLAEIARFFGLSPTAADEDAMAAAMSRDSKDPSKPFATPTAPEAPRAAVIEIARKFADEPYRRLRELTRPLSSSVPR